MSMVVSIVNITDAPGSKKSPTRLAIYTTHIDPGETLKLPAAMVDARLRDLEKQGYIAIGPLPSWYAASKAKKLGRRVLTHTEIEARFAAKKKSKDIVVPPKSRRIKLDDLKADVAASSEDTKTDKK